MSFVYLLSKAHVSTLLSTAINLKYSWQSHDFQFFCAVYKPTDIVYE